MKFNFSDITEDDFNLRYQLLFSTAGTLCIDADIHILLIIVFKTNLYNPKKGMKNRDDLARFLKRINAKTIGNDFYQTAIQGNELKIIYKEIGIY